MKFKVGDLVEVVNGVGSSSVGIGETGRVKSIRTNEVFPIIVEFNRNINPILRHLLPPNCYWFIESELQFVKSSNYKKGSMAKSLDNLQVGDFIFDEDGDKRLVLGVSKYCVWISDDDAQPLHYSDTDFFQIADLEGDGFTVDGIKEYTLQEIAEELDIPVSQLRIKE